MKTLIGITGAVCFVAGLAMMSGEWSPGWTPWGQVAGAVVFAFVVPLSRVTSSN